MVMDPVLKGVLKLTLELVEASSAPAPRFTFKALPTALLTTDRSPEPLRTVPSTFKVGVVIDAEVPACAVTPAATLTLARAVLPPVMVSDPVVAVVSEFMATVPLTLVANVTELFAVSKEFTVMFPLAPAVRSTLPVAARLPPTLMLPAAPVVRTRLLILDAFKLTESVSVMNAEPVDDSPMLETLVSKAVPPVPKDPEPDTRFNVRAEIVEAPLRVILPDVPAVNDTVPPAAVILPARAMSPAAPVFNEKFAAEEVATVTELASDRNTEPVVFADRFTTLVCISVPAAPISPEPETRFNVPPDRVKLPPRVIVPVVPAVKFIVPLAEESAFTTMLPAAPVVNVRLPTDEAFRFTEFASLIKAEPPVLADKLATFVCISVPETPMSPEPDARFNEPPESVKLPLRVIAPVVPAVNVIVPLADELPFTTMLPAAPVVSVRLSTDDAFKFTEFVSLTNAEPVVLTDKLPTVVCISVPAAPMSPEPDTRFSVPPDKVKLPLRVMVPLVPADKVIVPLAEESPAMTMLPAAPVVSVMLPTDEALRFTESASFMNAEPVVDTANAPVLV